MFDRETVMQICADWRRSHSLTTVAQLHGTSVTAIREVLTSEGVTGEELDKKPDKSPWHESRKKRGARPLYDQQTKDRAVRCVLAEGLTQKDAAERLGVSPNSVGRWVREALAEGWGREAGDPAPDSAAPSSEGAEEGGGEVQGNAVGKILRCAQNDRKGAQNDSMGQEDGAGQNDRMGQAERFAEETAGRGEDSSVAALPRNDRDLEGAEERLEEETAKPCPEWGCCCDHDRACCSAVADRGNSDHPGGCRYINGPQRAGAADKEAQKMEFAESLQELENSRDGLRAFVRTYSGIGLMDEDEADGLWQLSERAEAFLRGMEYGYSEAQRGAG